MKNIILISILIIVISSCSQQQIVDQKAEGEKLMELSREWAASAATDDLEKILNYWAEDAIVLPPGQSTLRGHNEIMQMLEGGAQIPGFEVNWEPKEVFVSKSGDLAYLIEHNYFAMDDSLGNQFKTFNKAVTIWKKQEDGSWKNVVDIWNEDPSITSIK